MHQVNQQLMKEKPIIFNDLLIRSLLDGRKTQTRRVIKAQPPQFWRGSCHYGKKGDRLWVRETWIPDAPCDGTWCDIEFYQCKSSSLDLIPERFKTSGHCIYKSCRTEAHEIYWRSPVSMPRWASRITLEITDVRAERLQDISEEDAKAEGIHELPLQEGRPGAWWRYEGFASNHYRTPIGAFVGLWETINKKPENSWEANPWVWVIEFKKLEN